LREKALRLKEEREEKEFMFMDTSHLNEDGQEYVRRRRKSILEGQKDNPWKSNWQSLKAKISLSFLLVLYFWSR